MLLTTLFSALLVTSQAAEIETYPKLEGVSLNSYDTYKKGDVIPLESSKRQIDTGEHFFDQNGNIVFMDFVSCQETQQPPTLKFDTDEHFKCTIKFEDRLYHLFQLYLHQDAPLLCRLPIRPKSDLYVPFDIQIRGDVLESHFDIDPNLNLLLFTDGEGGIVSGTSFSSSLNTTRVIIGTSVQLDFDVRWSKLEKHKTTMIKSTDVNDKVIKFPVINYTIPTKWNASTTYGLAIGVGAIVGSILTLVLSYRRLNRKVRSTYIESDKLE